MYKIVHGQPKKEAIKTCKSEEGVAKNAKTSESLVLSDEEEGGCKMLERI